jgi:hypothetical protein
MNVVVSMDAINVALVIFVALGGGLVLGLWRRDSQYEAMNKAQQERGDHWFDRYQEILNEKEPWQE